MSANLSVSSSSCASSKSCSDEYHKTREYCYQYHGKGRGAQW